METKKMILLLFLAFYFSCGFYQARKIFPSDGDATIAINSKYGQAAEAHVRSGRGTAGVVTGDGSRSPSNQGSSNFIPIYAANAHHNRHRGAASSHGSHNRYLALFIAMLFACICT